jgi:hypothetical protein
LCISKPKAPKVEPIPDRRASVLPDGGNPALRAADRSKRRLTSAAAIFTNQATLGAPMTTNVLGV